MNMFLRVHLGTAVLAIAGMSLAARADVILDTFNDRTAIWPLNTVVTDPSSVTTVPESASHVPGGQRMVGIGTSTMDVENFDTAAVDIHNSSGYSYLDYRSSVGAAATVELGYGQATPLNLVGANALKIAFLNYDLAQAGPLHIAATVTHAANTPFHCFFDVTTVGAQTVNIPLTGYAYGSVDSVVLDFVAPKGTDYRIDSVSVAVPEPASLALLGLGLPLLLKRRSRAA
jgi:hypothetical protein